MTDSTKDRQNIENFGILASDKFSEKEVKLLRELQRIYVARQERKHREETRRLEFIRWLVQTGRLSDQIA